MIKPFVKWVGSKAWIKDELAALVCQRLAPNGAYYESFLGGGSVMLEVAERRKRNRIVVSDTCSALANTWINVFKNPHVVADHLEALSIDTSLQTYNKIREEFNLPRKGGPREAAQFLYLNALCFNGIYRENKKGQFNVPYGYRKKPPFPDRALLEKISQTLGPRFRWSHPLSYEHAKEGDVAFQDPPYDGVFSSYSGDGFDETRQKLLAEKLKYCSDQGAFVIATNADTPLIRDIYAWAAIRPLEEPRRVGHQKNASKRAGCLLITSPW